MFALFVTGFTVVNSSAELETRAVFLLRKLLDVLGPTGGFH